MVSERKKDSFEIVLLLVRSSEFFSVINVVSFWTHINTREATMFFFIFNCTVTRTSVVQVGRFKLFVAHHSYTGNFGETVQVMSNVV